MKCVKVVWPVDIRTTHVSSTEKPTAATISQAAR